LKILQILYSLGPGGAERLVVDISNELAQQGHDIILCTLRDDTKGNNGFYKGDLSEKIKYINLSIPAGLRFQNILIFYRLIKKLDPQVVHSHLNLVNYLFPLTFIFRKIKFFHTIHSNPAHEISNSFEYKLRRYFYTHKRMKAITISQETTQAFLTYYKIKPFGEILNGRALPKPTPAFTEIKQEIQNFKDEGYSVFLHIGSCYPVKNQKMLVSAFNKLIHEGELVVLFIIGTGFDSELGMSLRNMAGDNIFFLGEKHNVSDYLLNADVFCLTSTREGMPISLIEAFACGCVPICTPVGGLINMIDNGKTGYLSKSVSEDDYLKSVRYYLGHRGKINKMDLIQYYHNQFSIEKCVNTYLTYFEE
jgi:glycosyltransferase involved in cell wall biosynthesis